MLQGSNICNLLSVVRYPIATPVTTSPCHLPPQKHSRPACLKRCALLLVSSPHSCPLAVPGDSPLRGSLSDRCANKCSLHPPPAALVCVARCIVHRTRFGGSPPVSERANAPHILENGAQRVRVSGGDLCRRQKHRSSRQARPPLRCSAFP